jgi:hypothetical protein
MFQKIEQIIFTFASIGSDGVIGLASSRLDWLLFRDYGVLIMETLLTKGRSIEWILLHLLFFFSCTESDQLANMDIAPASTFALQPFGFGVESTYASDSTKLSIDQWNNTPPILSDESQTVITHPSLTDTLKTSETLLVVSPYRTLPHLLDLQSVSKPYQLLAKALTLMQAIRPDYATAPYEASYNWQEISLALIELLKEDAGFQWTSEELYVIIFRSQVPPNRNRSRLAALDQLAHAEAMESGGLLKYWFGNPDADGRNLATCRSFVPSIEENQLHRKALTETGIWRARDDARKGGAGPGHRQAMRETLHLYTEWHVERLKLVVSDRGRSWNFIEWQD